MKNPYENYPTDKLLEDKAKIEKQLEGYKDVPDIYVTKDIYLSALHNIEEVIKGRDIVTVICYGSERKMERAKAIKEFTEAVDCCEGSERECYCNILSDLRAGLKVAKDEVEFYY